jgi:hypothetical protein
MSLRAAFCVALISCAAAFAAEKLPFEQPEFNERWQRLDLEGRWVAYRQAVASEPGGEEPWIKFLAQRKDFELLEWIGIYEFYGRYKMAAALSAADAPQWIRAAVWAVNHPDSHTLDDAQKILTEKNPGLVLSWLKAHTEAVNEAIQPVLQSLEAAAPAIQESSKFLPPLKLESVLAFLDAPEKLEEFGLSERAEPGKVYVHQVIRAINGLVVCKQTDEPWRAKLQALTKHSHIGVRRAAYQAYTHATALIPIKEFLATVEKSTDAEDRKMALLAVSYSPHPQIYALLHHISVDPKHPAWNVAMSRLGDLGNGFTLEHLKSLKPETLSAADQHFFEQQLKRIRERTATEDAPRIAAQLRVLFERAAWVDTHCDPLEQTLVNWTLKHVRAQVNDIKVQQALQQLKSYVEPPEMQKESGGFAGFQDRVRRYANDVLK